MQKHSVSRVQRDILTGLKVDNRFATALGPVRQNGLAVALRASQLTNSFTEDGGVLQQHNVTYSVLFILLRQLCPLLVTFQGPHVHQSRRKIPQIDRPSCAVMP